MHWRVTLPGRTGGRFSKRGHFICTTLYIKTRMHDTVWGIRLWKRFCKMFSESSTGRWAALQLPCCPSKQGNFQRTFYNTFFTTWRPTVVYLGLFFYLWKSTNFSMKWSGQKGITHTHTHTQTYMYWPLKLAWLEMICSLFVFSKCHHEEFFSFPFNLRSLELKPRFVTALLPVQLTFKLYGKCLPLWICEIVWIKDLQKIMKRESQYCMLLKLYG